MPQPYMHKCDCFCKKQLYLKLLVFVVCFIPMSYAHGEELDSLDVAQKTERLDFMPLTYRLKLYPDIISFYLNNDPTKALRYLPLNLKRMLRK